MEAVLEGYKRCSHRAECVHPQGPILPATQEYFGFRKDSPSKLTYDCRACQRASVKQCYQNHIDDRRASGRRYAQDHAEKRREYDKQYKIKNADALRQKQLDDHLAHPEKRRQIRHNFYWKDPESRRQYAALWRQRNPEKAQVASKRYYRKTQPARLLANKRYRKMYPEKIREQQRYYQRDHPFYNRRKSHNRRAREHALSAIFTDADFEYALSYFNDCCAVCGRTEGPTRTIAMDHWIPVSDTRSDNPGSAPKNMIPLCHGIGGCNNSKSNIDPNEWLRKRDKLNGLREAEIVAKRVDVFFESVRAG